MYPISRANLQNYCAFLRNQEEEKRREKILNQTIDGISQFITFVASHNNKGITLPTSHHLFKSTEHTHIITKLKERFPDTDFTFDVSGTMLTIDWS